MSSRIILADDHPVVRIGARTVITASGVGEVVAEANNAGELMGVLAQHACDVLVTDLSMPDSMHSDGYTMMERVCRTYPNLPIILLTVSNNLGMLRMISSLGVLGLIDKTSSMNELPLAIQTVLKGAPYICAPLKKLLEERAVNGLFEGKARALSPRETEVLRLFAQGMKISQIADKLSRGVSTISKQKSDAMAKLGVQNDAELFDYLRREGFSR